MRSHQSISIWYTSQGYGPWLSSSKTFILVLRQSEVVLKKHFLKTCFNGFIKTYVLMLHNMLHNICLMLCSTLVDVCCMLYKQTWLPTIQGGETNRHARNMQHYCVLIKYLFWGDSCLQWWSLTSHRRTLRLCPPGCVLCPGKPSPFPGSARRLLAPRSP